MHRIPRHVDDEDAMAGLEHEEARLPGREELAEGAGRELPDSLADMRREDEAA